MLEAKGYLLGQSAFAARRLELQDRYFADVSEKLLDMLALRPGDRVVELGCGPGSFSHRVLSRLGPGGVLLGVDSSAGLLGEAKAALAKVASPARFETVQADASKLGPWLEGADVVVGRLVLHHIPMVEFMLGRLRTLLRPGTRLGFLEPDVRTLLVQLGYLEATTRPEVAALRIWATHLNQLFLINRISPDVGATLAHALEIGGYRNVRTEWALNPPIGLMIDNMVMLYDEVRDTLIALGITSADEIAQQQKALRELPTDNLPPVWGSFRVVCEV